MRKKLLSVSNLSYLLRDDAGIIYTLTGVVTYIDKYERNKETY